MGKPVRLADTEGAVRLTADGSPEKARVVANDLLAVYNVLARIVDQMPEVRRAQLGLQAQSAQ